MKELYNKYCVGPYRFLAGVVLAVIIDMGDFLEKLVLQLEATLSAWQMKAAFGSVVSLLVQYNNSQYATIAQSIFWLVVLDIITRFLAISYQNLVEKGEDKDEITLWDSFKGWGSAFKAKKITSSAMTEGFVSKMIQFALILTAAAYIDNSLREMHIVLPLSGITFCIGYICYSEFLSVVENLRDSGVSHMDKLIELLTSNIFNKIRK